MTTPTPTPTARRTRAKTAAADAPRPQLTPEDWIEAATKVLVDQGIDHVRVDVLANEIGVTRGSFYWHFRDREDLLRRVLAGWRERATVDLTARLENANPDAAAQLRDVLGLPFRGQSALRAARIELAIRAWARRDDMARHAVDEADAARLAYIAQLFSALGFGVTEARARAAMLYTYVVAASMMPSLEPFSQRSGRHELMEGLLLKP